MVEKSQSVSFQRKKHREKTLKYQGVSVGLIERLPRLKLATSGLKLKDTVFEHIIKAVEELKNL